MNIIIIGCGKTGTTLAEQLHNEGHDLTLIDKNEKILRELAADLDVIGVTGNGAMLEVQQEANISRADLLIATTGSDETNMLCCVIAKKEGHCQTIAKINSFEYQDQIDYLQNALGISFVINPNRMCAQEISHLLRFPAAREIETFSNGKVDMISVVISEKAPFCDTALKNLNKQCDVEALICVIQRNGESIIPSGDTILKAGDQISFIAKPGEAAAFCRLCQPETHPNRSIFFVGGGKMAFYCAQYLTGRRRRFYSMKFLDIDPAACKSLAEAFPDATVINADGSSNRVLYEEGFQNNDCMVNITNMDEQNILLSLKAAGMTNMRLITKVNHFNPQELPRDLNVGSIVCPKTISANAVVRYVRGLEGSGNHNIESLYKLANDTVEAQEYEICDESEVTNIPLKDLNLKPETLIATIIRNGQIIRPGGSDFLKLNDHVVIITRAGQGIRDLKDILA